ncbi:hypothetical protein [Alkalibacillus salilacus]|uniref:Uncharacterized protein n=1 Tax=Alkalibacillus salilacus TaxID=284582 RepID=A0ABT9VD36_9BACI|nr:hypothetical protein [Alkalibacillus salilacus]MDQ0158851.1 hypothetical protein [Alkalibacillus salilacus]
MATKVHACLAGNWVTLNEDPDCKIGERLTSPNTWWEENAKIFSPHKRGEENTMYELDYVHIHFKGVDYRINPIFIQISQD